VLLMMMDGAERHSSLTFRLNPLGCASRRWLGQGSGRRSRKAARHVAEVLLRADALYANGDPVATDFMLHNG